MKKIYTDAQKETDTEKCPNCGGTLIFSPNHGKLRCEYCASFIDFEKKTGIIENELCALFDKSSEWTEMEVYRCNNCGAKEVVCKSEISKKCPFCGTSNVIRTEELSGIKPHGVVPFRLTIPEAAAVAKKWLSSKFFAPKTFKNSATPKNINGIYNPVFTFDSNTHSTYSGRLGENYTVTRTVNGRTVRQTRTRYFNVSGTYKAVFDDLLVQACEKIEQKNINAIEPFPTNKANEYDSKFMTGFAANQYTKDGKACYTQAKQIMDSRIRRAILSKYRHDVVSFLNVNTAYSEWKFKYILLPIFIGHTLWKTKIYNFFVNGHNGKISGKTPVSALKIILVVLLVLGLLFLIVVLPMILA